MTRSELEYDLMKVIAIRMIGWDVPNCIIKAKEWAPKVIQAFPDMFPNEKVEPIKTGLAQTPNPKMQATSGMTTIAKPPRSVGRRA
jgi:hypothetical protein